jgi:hypothetical protein
MKTKEEIKERMRKYNQRPEVKARRRELYKSEKYKEKRLQYRIKNREKLKMKARAYRKTEKGKQYAKEYSKKYREENKEELKKKMKEWSIKNREYKSAKKYEWRMLNYDRWLKWNREYNRKVRAKNGYPKDKKVNEILRGMSDPSRIGVKNIKKAKEHCCILMEEIKKLDSKLNLKGGTNGIS